MNIALTTLNCVEANVYFNTNVLRIPLPGQTSLSGDLKLCLLQCTLHVGSIPVTAKVCQTAKPCINRTRLALKIHGFLLFKHGYILQYKIIQVYSREEFGFFD